MIPLPDGTFRFSPRDLVAYLEGDFAAWCDRMAAERRHAGGAGSAELEWVQPDASDPEAALAIQKGNEHEQRYLAGIKERFPTILELDRNDPDGPARTLAAMASAVPVIYQAHLVSDGWAGYPDFLYVCPGNGCPCGGRHYTPWDTKLARSAKPSFLIQLCAYADFLEAMRGYRPDQVGFVFGHGEERTFPTRHYFHYYRQLRRSFSSFQRAWDVATVPDPGLDRSWGEWEGAAEAILKQKDHLSRVAFITRGQVRRLEDSGVVTLTALAGCDASTKPARMSAAIFDRLQTQARLQLQSEGLIQPLYEPRPPVPGEGRRGLAQLPPRSDGDVFFDMEGFPYAAGGLEYLFGAVTVDEITPVFHDWWAHDSLEERAAFEEFIDWLMARRRQHPTLHVYHYASYEETALKHLMGKYATREAEVDELLRNDVFVDLYKVLRQAFVIGTSSYSLKYVERLYLPPRTGTVLSAGGSVVEYQRWIESDESRRWEESAILGGIREYNKTDCESTKDLCRWLRDRQAESRIAYAPDPLADKAPPEISEERAAAEALADRLVERGRTKLEAGDQGGHLDQLVGWLVGFHRREEKPMWWRKFKRHDMTIEERIEDRDCLGGLIRTETPARVIKKSVGLEYHYPEQETTCKEGDRCFAAGTESRAQIVRLDEVERLVEIKTTSKLPDKLCLIPDEWVSAEVIKDAIARYASGWEQGNVVSQAVDDMLRRRPPRIAGHTGGRLVGATEDPAERLPDLAARLEQSTLSVQGPPGSGKTYNAAEVIVELLARGKRVGVTAQSHKVIMNALRAVAKALERRGRSAALYKVGDHEDDELVASGVVRKLENDEVSAALDEGPCLVGGTAWLFAREELTGRFDHVVIDEAGQFSLANAVAVGLSARNLILVGDQMQLAQVTQGYHPEETGLSCLEYVLHGQSTVPEDRGIFLAKTRRMHPDVCRFISEAVYDGRLHNIPETERHRILRGSDTRLVTAETGVAWVPVEHDDCSQRSEEECDAIEAIVDELLRRRVVDRDGVERPLKAEDILIVAPFNLQVHCLRGRLDPGVRIGSVDKFQGQEAPVVIVSLCSSTLDESPRGASFLLSPNRLNVAVSRAEALAIVVGSPDLIDVRCRSVEEMRLVNLLCHLVQYSEEHGTVVEAMAR
ncbi:MAG TPA: TM0106 family RecB-like putative nuclease [Gemmatimonadales bacterium]|nr:TM0106 family RecB-like putative nuclease [Gemmatimonadales bacterium]